MMKPARHFLFLLLLASCAQTADPLLQGPPFQEIHFGPAVGAIIPSNSASDLRFLAVASREFWTPTEEQILRLEERLEPALEQAEAHQYVLEHLARYRRQYIGITVDGKQRILVNAFPAAEEHDSDPHYYWLHQFVFVNDGGYHYWTIEYDPETGAFSAFRHNGWA